MGTPGDRKTSAGTAAAAALTAQLAPLGAVTSKSMFGGHGLFEGGAMFAMVTSAGDLYLKADAAARAHFEAAGAERHAKMPYWRVPPAVLDDDDALADWARAAIASAHPS